MICNGCVHAAKHADNRILCPFCRTRPPTSNGEIIERLKKRVEANDSNAIRLLGCYYRNGKYGMRQNNMRKANALFLQAGELGNARGYSNIVYAYYYGEGVERDGKKSKYYCELGAMGGNEEQGTILAILRRRQITG